MPDTAADSVYGSRRKIRIPEADPFLKYNPGLERAIEEYYDNNGADEYLYRVVQALMVCMHNEGHVLVPIEPPENLIQSIDPETVKEGDELKPEGEVSMKLIHYSNDEGRIVMPVYTSMEKLLQDAPQGGVLRYRYSWISI